MATVSDLKSRAYAEQAYILFIEGHPIAYVTDHIGDSLYGSGAGTWIGSSESALSETVGERTVKGGLIMPSTLPTGPKLNPKTGMFDVTTVTFRLLDYDNTLQSLFATEGKDADYLAQRIAPGTSALSSTIAIQGGQTVDPADKYIGIERIGPNRERRMFPVLPLAPFGQLIGYEHAVNQNAQDDEEGPPRVLVSDDPIVWDGRMVAVYRLYRDLDSADESYSSWPTWDEQYEANPPVFLGTLTDRGMVDGGRSWELKCKDASSLLRKQLNKYTHSEWMRVASSTVTLDLQQRGVGLSFESRSGGQVTQVFDSVAFSTNLTGSGTASSYLSEIADIIADTLDGSTSDYGADGAADAWKNANFAMQAASMFVRRDAETPNPEMFVARLILHEKIWRLLGYEPALQFHEGTTFTDEKQIRFTQMPAGHVVDQNSNAVPGEGYWEATLTTLPVGKDQTQTQFYDNGGGNRHYYPLHNGAIILFDKLGGQSFTVSGASFPYIEGQPTVPRAQGDHARYFVFRGQIAKGLIDGSGNVVDENGQIVDEIENEEIYQVAKVSWNEGDHRGSVAEPNGLPELTLDAWMDPRLFGFNFKPITGEWAATTGGEDFKIECIPLASYAYAAHAGELERAPDVFLQLLLSTGTASGYADTEENNPTFTSGSNSPTTAHFWSGDHELADVGLGIPYQIVQSPEDVHAVFAEIAGANTPLNRVRYDYGAVYSSYDVIRSLIAPRGLALSFHDAKFGVQRLSLFSPDEADVTISESDVVGDMGSPASVIPKQKMRAIGQVDKTKLEHRLQPIEGATQSDLLVRSRDPGVVDRSGNIEHTIYDHGLVPSSWMTDVQTWKAWEQDFRDLWAFEQPKFFSKRHFLITGLQVKREKGQDLRSGTRVRISNPWPVNPAGGYGITDAVGVVLDSRCLTRNASYLVDLLVYADQFEGIRFFMPIAKIWAVNGTEITLYPDSMWLNHGQGSDASLFSEPAFSSIGGQARVTYLEYDRVSWSISSETAQVVSTDADSNTVTLDSAFSTAPRRDTDKYLIMVDYDNQDADWVTGRGIVVVLDSWLFGGASTMGFKLIDG